MVELEQIVAKMSGAQKAWLLNAQPTLEHVDYSPDSDWWDACPLYVHIDGIDYWLGAKSMTSKAGETTFTSGWERLSDLGLAVRAILKEQPQ
jgi:hypothetical protein